MKNGNENENEKENDNKNDNKNQNENEFRIFKFVLKKEGKLIEKCHHIWHKKERKKEKKNNIMDFIIV